MKKAKSVKRTNWQEIVAKRKAKLSKVTLGVSLSYDDELLEWVNDKVIEHQSDVSKVLRAILTEAKEQDQARK